MPINILFMYYWVICSLAMYDFLDRVERNWLAVILSAVFGVLIVPALILSSLMRSRR